MQRTDREKKHYDHDLLMISASTVSALLVVGGALLMLVL